MADLDDKLAALREITAKLEQGELSLEDSLAEYERGVGLVVEIKKALNNAEARVEIIQRNGDQK